MFPYATPSQPNYMDADPMQGMIKAAQYPVMGLNPPSSFDNMNNPYSSMNMQQPSSYSSNAYSAPQYARGGSVQPQNLMRQAQNLRQYGQGGDDILAHINPEEAMMLAQHSGGDINPYTGLPQFGFFGKIGKFFKKVVGPVVGSVIGTAVGGPVGGVIGGSIGGSFGHPKNRMGPVNGALLPLAYHAAGPALGLPGASGIGGITSQLGKIGTSLGLGNMFGGEAAGSGGFMSSLGNMFGGGNAAASTLPRYSADVVGKVFNGAGIPSQYLLNGPGSSSGGFLQGIGNILGGGATGGAGSQGGLLGSIGNILGGGSSEGGIGGGLGSLLGGANGLNNALLATSLIGTMKGQGKQQGPKTPEEIMEYSQRKWRPEDYERGIPNVKRKYRPAPLNYRPGIDPEHSYIEDEENEAPINKYRGGRIDMSNGGYLGGDTGGHADKIKANLADGEYVLSADVVSHLGDGNNRNGAKKLDSFMKNVRAHKATKGFPPKAKVINEYMKRTRRA